MFRSESKPHALVVDDSEADRMILARFLEAQGFQVDKAVDGLAAERMLANRRYDVLISDLRMPRKHGHQLIVETLERPHPPVIFALTGLAEPKLVGDLIARGVLDVIQKPVSYDLLAVKIRAQFDRAKAQERQAQPPANGPSLITATRSSAPDMGEQLSEATTNLRAELARVTETFQQTILALEDQKNAIENDYQDFMRLMGELLNAGGGAGSSHVGRVEALANQVTGALGLSPRDRQVIGMAALMHDIGQFGMPDELRMKAISDMTDTEREIFVRYPVIGAALLCELKGAEPSAVLVEAHAENFDGSGFPSQLQRDAIPLGSRIIRIADGLDNFFRYSAAPRNEENAREHLNRFQGKCYDPELVEWTLKELPGFLGSSRPPDKIRTIPVHDVPVGAVTAENIYDRRGHFLAREGVELSAPMLLRLRQIIGNKMVAVYTDPHPKN